MTSFEPAGVSYDDPPDWDAPRAWSAREPGPSQVRLDVRRPRGPHPFVLAPAALLVGAAFGLVQMLRAHDWGASGFLGFFTLVLLGVVVAFLRVDPALDVVRVDTRGIERKGGTIKHPVIATWRLDRVVAIERETSLPQVAAYGNAFVLTSLRLRLGNRERVGVLVSKDASLAAQAEETLRALLPGVPVEAH
jgi:hypothetical protein